MSMKVLVPFVFGVIYINIVEHDILQLSFSPLRFWGHLYHVAIRDELRKGFSPLRFWGHLYHMHGGRLQSFSVLVPFVFGVIYIPSKILNEISIYIIFILIFFDIDNLLFIFYHKFFNNQYSKIRFSFFNIFSPKVNSPDKTFILLN